MDEKTNLIRQLNKLKKDEIIAGIARMDLYSSRKLLHYIQAEKSRAAFAKEKKLFTNWQQASDAYIKWLHDMADKYGDGVKFNCARLTEAERLYGIHLNRAFTNARELHKKASRELDAAVSIDTRLDATTTKGG